MRLIGLTISLAPCFYLQASLSKVQRWSMLQIKLHKLVNEHPMQILWVSLISCLDRKLNAVCASIFIELYLKLLKIEQFEVSIVLEYRGVSFGEIEAIK